MGLKAGQWHQEKEKSMAERTESKHLNVFKKSLFHWRKKRAMNNLNNYFSIFREDNAASFPPFSCPKRGQCAEMSAFKEKKKQTY